MNIYTTILYTITFFLLLFFNLSVIECNPEEILTTIPQGLAYPCSFETFVQDIPVFNNNGISIAVPELSQNMVENANYRPQEAPLLQESNKFIWCLICCGCIVY